MHAYVPAHESGGRQVDSGSRILGAVLSSERLPGPMVVCCGTVRQFRSVLLRLTYLRRAAELCILIKSMNAFRRTSLLGFPVSRDALYAGIVVEISPSGSMSGARHIRENRLVA